MKKILSVVAMTVMLLGMAGCMDSPDGAQQHVSKNN